MKTTRKILSALIAAVMLASCMGVGSSAAVLPDGSMNAEEWNTYFSALDNTMISLTPGSDETQLNVCWHTSASAAPSQFKIGKGISMSDAITYDAYATQAEDEAQRVNRVIAAGLEANTEYYYAYTRNDGSWSAPALYRTLSADTFKVLFVTDIQISPDRGSGEMRNDSYCFNNVLSTALKSNDDISFILNAGDSTESGNNPVEWIGTLAPPALRNLPMASAIGNHDKKGLSYKYYTFSPNNYDEALFPSEIGADNWFRYGEVLFLVYDSTCGSVEDHNNFTEDAIKANKDAKWRVAMMHHDLNGSNDSANSAESRILFRNIYGPLFEKYDIDLALTGHSHTYGRSHQMGYAGVLQNVDGIKSVTNPEGTVYVSGSTACYKYDAMEYDKPAWIAYRFEEPVNTYTTLEFSHDSLALRTCRCDTEELVDEYTINKTDTYEEEIDPAGMFDLYAIVRILGLIFGMIASLGSKFN
ncbi:MAG: metallophosphoesterase family protein [Clostridiales bacterium]|nr:metallophosphoesterase family protein [Clostridiales bacterium]